MVGVSAHSLLAVVTISAAVGFAACTGSALATRSNAPSLACSAQPYSYAGLFSNLPAQGIAASVTALSSAPLANGHVAGWIGVGGYNAGPEGQADWLQAGLNTQAGIGSQLYAEIEQPGQPIVYDTLASNLAASASYRLAVQQVAGRPNVWQVLVNGTAATAPVYLAGSGSFEPMAMSEAWDGGTSTCNAFSYRFDHLQIMSGGSWRALSDTSPLADAGYALSDRSIDGFTASSVS